MLGSLAAAPAVAKLPWRPVSFRTVAVGDGDGSQPRKGLVVRGEKRWRKVWRSLTAGAEPRPPIDFSRHMLLVASQGRQPSSGHRLRITSVGTPGGVLIVDVTEVSPGKGCPAGGVLTSPYHVVRVRRTDTPVRFFAPSQREEVRLAPLILTGMAIAALTGSPRAHASRRSAPGWGRPSVAVRSDGSGHVVWTAEGNNV